MKQVLLLALTTVAMSQLGVAASCGSGSLADYVALGPGGCTIGSDTLSDFQVLTGFSGGTAIAPGSVTITPMGGTYTPGFTISVNQSASSANPLEAIFTYDISGLMYTGIAAVLGGSSETMDGGVTGLVNFCEGASFGPDGVDGCAVTNGSLLTLDGVQNSDSGTFAKVSFVNVTDDLTIDPGTGGTAKGGTLTNSFTAVPEPVTSALTGLGLALAGGLKFRRVRAKQESK